MRDNLETFFIVLSGLAGGIIVYEYMLYKSKKNVAAAQAAAAPSPAVTSQQAFWNLVGAAPIGTSSTAYPYGYAQTNYGG